MILFQKRVKFCWNYVDKLIFVYKSKECVIMFVKGRGGCTETQRTGLRKRMCFSAFDERGKRCSLSLCTYFGFY